MIDRAIARRVVVMVMFHTTRALVREQNKHFIHATNGSPRVAQNYSHASTEQHYIR